MKPLIPLLAVALLAGCATAPAPGPRSTPDLPDVPPRLYAQAEQGRVNGVIVLAHNTWRLGAARKGEFKPVYDLAQAAPAVAAVSEAGAAVAPAPAIETQSDGIDQAPTPTPAPPAGGAPEPEPAAAPEAVRVFFATDSAEVPFDAVKRLQALAAAGAGETVVLGFADPRGARAYNEALSRRRARAVAAVLREAGLAKLQVEACGEQPEASAPFGAQRRVEVRRGAEALGESPCTQPWPLPW